MNWFLYDRDLRHERVKLFNKYSTILSLLFCCCSHVSSCKNNYLFRLRAWTTLFTSFMHSCKHPFWSCLVGMLKWHGKKIAPERRNPSFVKSDFSFVKDIWPSRDEIIFTCNQKYIFWWKWLFKRDLI